MNDFPQVAPATPPAAPALTPDPSRGQAATAAPAPTHTASLLSFRVVTPVILVILVVVSIVQTFQLSHVSSLVKDGVRPAAAAAATTTASAPAPTPAPATGSTSGTANLPSQVGGC